MPYLPITVTRSNKGICFVKFKKNSISNSISKYYSKTKKLWLGAIKLPIYTVIIIPSLIAATCVFSISEQTKGLEIQHFMGSSALIIAWLNISNDVFDADSGVDLKGRKPESVVNILGWKKHNSGTLASLFLCYGLIHLRKLTILTRPNLISISRVILTGSILLGYIYQGPPTRLSNYGLGEPLCFMAFGPFATTALYLSMMPMSTAIHCGVMPVMVMILSILIGMTTTFILFSSHFHQVDGDRLSGKMSPVVKLGTSNSSVVFLTTSFIFMVLEVILSVLKTLPPMLPELFLIQFVAASYLVALVWRYHDTPRIIASSKIQAAFWHSLNGLMLVISIITPT
jgi:1,4-dihydroxy-2-naphthoate octaprenyltransferase